MLSDPSPGAEKPQTMHNQSERGLRAALAVEKPLQVVGVINAYAALLAKRAGFQALYLSGGGVAAASHGPRAHPRRRRRDAHRRPGAGQALRSPPR